MFGRKKLLAHIEKLEERLTQLENMHSTVEKKSTYWLDLDFGFFDTQYTYAGLQGEYCGRKLTAEELKIDRCIPKLESIPLTLDI